MSLTFFLRAFFLQEKADYKHTSRIGGFRPQQRDLGFKPKSSSVLHETQKKHS